MLAEQTKIDITKVAPFPPDTYLRVNIEGLAVCEFNAEMSKFHFLQFVKYHKLRFSIVKKNIATGDPVVIKDFDEDPAFIPENVSSINISVGGSKVPSSHEYPESSLRGEKDLNLLIDLNDLHKLPDVRLILDPKLSSTTPITTLKMKHAAFYTSKETKDKYKVNVGMNLKETSHLCFAIGGYIKSEVSSQIKIDIPDSYSETFPISDGKNRYQYEINFTNHCQTKTPEQVKLCKDFIGDDGQDVKYLYDILEPRILKENKVNLVKNNDSNLDKISAESENEKPSAKATENVAACLPAQVSP